MAEFRAGWWWIDRWRKSTAYTDMTLAEQGAYRNLLDELWLRGGVLPNDERILAKISGDALAWPEVRTAVLARFYDVPEGLRNETHDEVSSQSKDYRDGQRAAGKARAATGERGPDGRFLSSRVVQPGGPAGASRTSSLRTPTPTPDQEPAPTPKKTRSRSRTATRDIGLVLAHYQTFHPRAKPGDKERRLVADRLKEGYTVADLQAAIDGNHRSPYHCGDNDRRRKYHDLGLILRNSDKVRDFMEIPENGQVPVRGVDAWEPPEVRARRQA